MLVLLVSALLAAGCGGRSKSAGVGDAMGDAPGAGSVTEVLEPAPVIRDFILGPGDELSVEVFGHKELTRKVRLGPSGDFYYPFLGYVDAGGMTVRELRTFLTEGISRYYVDPQVGITATALRSQKIFVLGAVTRPGVFPLEQPVTAFEVILRAGGFNDRANRSSIMLVRSLDSPAPEVRRLDLEQVYKEGEFEDNVYLQGGDILYVPENFLTNVEDFVQHINVLTRPLLDIEREVILWPDFIDIIQTGERQRK
jgi:polysaccharide export outer membrane protein